jgi:c(7)-type cytochrome triheme protein
MIFRFKAGIPRNAGDGKLPGASPRILNGTSMTLTKMLCAGLGAMLVLVVIPLHKVNAAEKDGGFVVYPGVSGSPGPVVFSHREHGIRKAGYACVGCHTSASSKTLNVTMDAIRQGLVCGSCHDGKIKGPRSQFAASAVQNCSDCHMPAADIAIILNRMDPAVFSHIRHLAPDMKKKAAYPSWFSCSDCHPEPFERAIKGLIGMEVPHESGGCANCHNGQRRSDGMPTAFAANTRCLTCHKPSPAEATDAPPQPQFSKQL